MSSPVATPPRVTYRAAFRRFERRIVWAIVYYNFVLALGTIGYRTIEGWRWFDSLYMCVITATSVGYSEVHPLSPAGRWFTMGLLAFAVVGLGLLWAIITALLIELDLGKVFRRRRIMKRVQQMSDHYLICGAGRMGQVIIGEMARAGVPFVVIESSPEQIERLQDAVPMVTALEGDATRDSVLVAAGIHRARALAATLSSDADNVFLCLTARELNSEIQIVSRAVDEASVAKMRRAGAHHIVSTNVTGGVRMATMLLRPAVVSFLDAATVSDDLSLRLEETQVPPSSHLAGKSLGEARIPQETGLIVLALRRGGEGQSPLFNPGPETRLNAGDVMIVLGKEEQLHHLREYAEA